MVELLAQDRDPDRPGIILRNQLDATWPQLQTNPSNTDQPIRLSQLHCIQLSQPQRLQQQHRLLLLLLHRLQRCMYLNQSLRLVLD